MRQYIWVSIVVFVLSGCTKSGTLPGFSVLESGLEYKLIALGDETQPVNNDDHLVLNLTAETLKGEQLASNYPYAYDKPVIFHKQSSSLFMEGLSRLMIGDSAAFILPCATVKEWLPLQLPDTQRIVVNLGIKDRMPPEWFALQQRFPGMAISFDDEVTELNSFFDTVDAIATLDIGDMYYIEVKEGEGAHPTTGDVVRVHYEAFFTDGKKFDSTYDRNEPFEYRVGESGQVLLGFNIGVRQLREQAESYFVLPAHLAFEKRGSTDGTVPPGTTVIYRVKLLSIHHEEA